MMIQHQQSTSNCPLNPRVPQPGMQHKDPFRLEGWSSIHPPIHPWQISVWILRVAAGLKTKLS